MAITSTVLYLLFILAFIIHDGEEIAVEHKWLLAHAETLREKHPKLRRMLNPVFMAFSIHLIVHLGQSIVVRGYVPGFVTSILLLPFSYLGMKSIWNTFSMAQLLLWGIIGLIIIAANLTFAHWLGIKMTK